MPARGVRKGKDRVFVGVRQLLHTNERRNMTSKCCQDATKKKRENHRAAQDLDLAQPATARMKKKKKNGGEQMGTGVRA